jgi:glycosyltransferase involved in cell wall biosynthesis
VRQEHETRGVEGLADSLTKDDVEVGELGLTTTSVLVIDSAVERGGAQVVTEELLRHLDRSRFSPIVVTLVDGPWARSLQTHETVLIYPQPRLHQVGGLSTLVRQIVGVAREHRVALIHASENTNLPVATLVSKFARLPIVWSVHDPLSGPTRGERVTAAILNHSRPDAVIFSNDRVRDAYPRHLRESGHQIPLGVALERVSGGNVGRARERWDVPSGSPMVVCLARFVPSKGQKFLIRAVAKTTFRPAPTVILCGPSHDGHARYLENLKRLAHRLELEANVRFGGFIEDDERTDLLSAADVVVHPALEESFGLSVLEAMATGTAVLASAASGPASLIDDGRTGVLVPPGNVEDLAVALDRLLRNADERSRLGHAAEEAASAFSWQRMADSVQRVWSDLTEGSARTGLSARHRR